ncbi:MAG: BMP family ABC transporter substrate-binding protein [Clostridia bacterium]|nr:BMP family ABC transporter substrate-binding protein [Clostridia bacterium]
MKKSLKIICALMSLCMVIGLFAACSGKEDPTTTAAPDASVADTEAPAADESAAPAAQTDLSELKIGFIFLHDENSTYDKNFMDAAYEAQAALGLSDEQVLLKPNIPEGDECYQAACELVDEGCDIIFADSFGHEDYMIRAAKEFPEVQFCHATGTKAHTENLANFHNALASIYEGRFLAGVAAGLKLNEMIEAGDITAEQAKIGYVGAYPYAEVKSGYTSFFLGARYICPSATMEVKFTNSWYDEALEKEAANALIQADCVLISQHADSLGAPTACEEAGVPNVSYNGSTAAAGPNTYIVSSRINWEPYYELIINAVANGSVIPADWTGTFETGSVELAELGAAAAEGTAEKLAEIEDQLKAGTLHVFDTSTFTVGGEALDEYLADVDSDEAYQGDTQVVIDGYFDESNPTFRSAPYFDLDIDGITLPVAE